MDGQQTSNDRVDGAGSRVDRALAGFGAALDGLVVAVEAGGLDGLDDLQLVGFVQGFERVRNRLPVVDHRVIRDAQARRLPETLTQTSMANVLTQALRISAAEAGRRVRAAEQVGDRVSMLGEPLAPRRPVLAAAQRAGSVTPDQVTIIVTALHSVDRPGFDPAAVDAGERLLTGFAETMGPQDLRGLAETVVDRIDPDGSRPRDQLNSDRRHLHLRSTRDGAWRGEFRLTGPLGAKLTALLGPLTKPRVNTTTTESGRLVEAPDERSHGQRMHDALDQVCDRLLRAGGVPASGGTPATVIVTVTADTLLTGSGSGTTSDGTRLSVDQILDLAGQAEIWPVWLTPAGAVLDLGRTRRIATPTQTVALIARDAGCSFPGCAHPAEWCERHHIVEWVHGGRTDLNNLTLLCRYHHHNYLARGWTCRLNADGLPAWTPPRWLDPTQTPMINTRIIAHHAARRHGVRMDSVRKGSIRQPMMV